MLEELLKTPLSKLNSTNPYDRTDGPFHGLSANNDHASGTARRRSGIVWVFKAILLFLVHFLIVDDLQSQIIEVPIDLQVPLFLKATTYDRNFPAKLQKNGVLQVGICYQERNRISIQEMEALEAELSKKVSGFTIQLTMILVTETETFERRKEWQELTALYITSMRGIKLDKLLAQTQKHQVISVCTDQNLVGKGVTMGFEVVGSRPRFVINRDNAIAEGCDFSAQLLNLATIH